VVSGRYRVTETTPRPQEPARTTTKVDISDNGAVTIVSLPRLESLVSTITFSPVNADGTARAESFDSVRVAATDSDKTSDKTFFKAALKEGQLVMTVIDRAGIVKAPQSSGRKPMKRTWITPTVQATHPCESLLVDRRLCGGAISAEALWSVVCCLT
jgi:hypothetical protein